MSLHFAHGNRAVAAVMIARTCTLFVGVVMSFSCIAEDWEDVDADSTDTGRASTATGVGATSVVV